MKKYYKKRYCLSDQGAANLVKSTWCCVLAYFSNLAPMFLLMLLSGQLILGEKQTIPVYIAASVCTLILMYILLSNEYVSLYNATYKESANLRIDLAEHLSKLPIAYFSKHDLSDLSQTIMSDVERIEHAMSHAIPKVVGMWIFFPVMWLLMAVGNWKMGLAATIPNLLSFALIPLAKRGRVKANNEFYDVLRENSELFQGAVEMQQEISSFNQSEKVKRELYEKMEESEKIHFKVEFGSMMTVGLSWVFAFISVAVVIAVGVSLLMQGEISVLYLIGYVIAALKIKDLFDISREGVLEMFYIEPAVNRIKEIKNTELQEGEETEFSEYDIEFKNVSFAYDPKTKVLNDVSFTARRGEVTAIAGASGSGKTSVLRLVSRLYDYDGGSILIGGQDIKKISTDSLFQKVSIVFQDVMLFNTSVLENIRLGNPKASDEEVKKAARLANCMDFIEKLPEGFQTTIGENGAELSGGERQRLSIARAFLKDAPILILDEISASLDVDNEKKIQESLNRLIPNKTVLIISHRLKSIENADRIVMIDGGYVESAGRHEELLERSPVYRNLIQKTKMAETFHY